MCVCVQLAANKITDGNEVDQWLSRRCKMVFDGVEVEDGERKRASESKINLSPCALCTYYVFHALTLALVPCILFFTHFTDGATGDSRVVDSSQTTALTNSCRARCLIPLELSISWFRR